MRVEPCKCQRLQASSPECKRSTACFGAFYLVISYEYRKMEINELPRADAVAGGEL